MNKIQIIMIGTLTLFGLGLNHVDAWALKAADPKWSFEFKDVSVKEALGQISAKAGVTFTADEQLIEKILDEKMLHKSYCYKNLDKIIQDIFEQDNCAFTWLYKNNRLNQVEIWVVGDAQEKKPGIKKAGGAGFFNQSGRTVSSNKLAPSPLTKSINKNQRRFKNSGYSAFTQPGRLVNPPQKINPPSIVPDSKIDITQSNYSKNTLIKQPKYATGNVTGPSKIVNLLGIAYDSQSSGSNMKIDSVDPNYPTDNTMIIPKTETIGNSEMPSLSNMLPIIEENDNMVSMINLEEGPPTTIFEEEMPNIEETKDENQEITTNPVTTLPAIIVGEEIPNTEDQIDENEEITTNPVITLPAIMVGEENTGIEESKDENDEIEVNPVTELPAIINPEEIIINNENGNHEITANDELPSVSK